MTYPKGEKWAKESSTQPTLALKATPTPQKLLFATAAIIPAQRVPWLCITVQLCDGARGGIEAFIKVNCLSTQGVNFRF